MSDRFELEQHILKCWGITSDIDLLYKQVLENDMSKDDIANFLLGMKTIYDLKFNELFLDFEKMIEEKKII